jgi:glycosyltransferase 2 family protein
MLRQHGVKLTVGIAIGAVFFYLAVRRIDIDQMRAALAAADYTWVTAAGLLMLFSHYLRALRWRYFLAPIRTVGTPTLYSALMIGYAANTFIPAHLGEFLRAFVLGKKESIPTGAAFASIVVERIVDVISLIVVMAFVVIVHPFPQWVVSSGWIMLGGSLALLVVLVVCKRHEAGTRALVERLARPLPARLVVRLGWLTSTFLAGIVPLKSPIHYAITGGLSVAIWAGYAAVYYACLEAFHFVGTYALPWHVGLVVLVLTTISVVIPSTPGYVGTFHYLCQVALVMFGVPPSEALSYAVVAHLLGVAPALVIGLLCANYEGVSIYRTAAETRR